MLSPYFREKLEAGQAGWRRVLALAIENGISVPAFYAALSYYDGYRSESLPANLLQAQRDYFGAHTYERIDRPRGEFFHTDWTALGTASSGTYNAGREGRFCMSLAGWRKACRIWVRLSGLRISRLKRLFR